MKLFLYFSSALLFFTSVGFAEPVEDLTRVVDFCADKKNKRVECERRFWSFVDVTQDQYLTTAEIVRFGRILTDYLNNQVQEDNKKKNDFIVWAMLFGPIAAELVIANFDYDGDGRVSRSELYTDVQEGDLETVVNRLSSAGRDAAGEAMGLALGQLMKKDFGFDGGKSSEPLSAGEMNKVRKQFSKCWNLPPGAREAKSLEVDINVVMNPDGMVRQAKIQNRRKMGQDPLYRSTAESALRAVLNKRCQPIKLPPAKYEQWKSMLLTFNPKDMF